VAWIAERKTLLAVCFSLISLIMYLGYIHKTKMKYYCASLFFFLLALLSKPISAPLPLIMLLLNIWPLEHMSKKKLLQLIPFFLLSLGFAIITYISQKNAAALFLPKENPNFVMHSSVFNVGAILAYDFIFYLTKFLVPVHLTPLYPPPTPFSFANPLIVATSLGALVLISLAIFYYHRNRAWLIGLLLFFVTILPSSGIIGFTRVLTHNKYAYFAMIGFLLPLAWLLKKLWELPNLPKAKLRSVKALILSLILILFVAEGMTAGQYLA
jgi:hypothetical protein